MEYAPGTDRYVEVVDHALTTSRAVRMRLDLERAVDDQVSIRPISGRRRRIGSASVPVAEGSMRDSRP